MTQSTTKPLAFSSANRRKIDVNFEAGVVTNDAGLLLLREADRQIALIDAVDSH